jgi:hypothetical protein
LCDRNRLLRNAHREWNGLNRPIALRDFRAQGVFNDKSKDHAWPRDVFEVLQYVLNVIVVPQHY